MPFSWQIFRPTLIGGDVQAEGTLKLSGKIQENEEKSASIVSHFSGRIEQLYVSYTGEKVKKGQKIALVYSPDLITAQRELLEAQKVADTNPALLESAKNKLRNWKISDAQINAVLAEGKIQEQFTIYAQHAGVITEKKVDVGDYLNVGEVLFNVQNLNEVWVVFDAYESDLKSIQVGDQVTFTTNAFPSEKFTTRVSFIDPLVNPTTRSVAIRGVVNNRNGKLKPEMFVQGEIQLTNSSANVENQPVLVPKSAVLWTGTRSVRLRETTR